MTKGGPVVLRVALGGSNPPGSEPEGLPTTNGSESIGPEVATRVSQRLPLVTRAPDLAGTLPAGPRLTWVYCLRPVASRFMSTGRRADKGPHPIKRLRPLGEAD